MTRLFQSLSILGDNEGRPAFPNPEFKLITRSVLPQPETNHKEFLFYSPTSKSWRVQWLENCGIKNIRRLKKNGKSEAGSVQGDVQLTNKGKW